MNTSNNPTQTLISNIGDSTDSTPTVTNIMIVKKDPGDDGSTLSKIVFEVKKKITIPDTFSLLIVSIEKNNRVAPNYIDVIFYESDPNKGQGRILVTETLSDWISLGNDYIFFELIDSQKSVQEAVVRVAWIITETYPIQIID